MKLGMCLLVWLAGFGFVGEVNAQWHPYAARPVRSLDRWLGVGYSGGYHTHNPGPDSDYYQPYSELNSRLQSWQPTESQVPQIREKNRQDWRAPEEFPRGNESGKNRRAPTWLQVGERYQANAASKQFGWDPSPRTAEAQRIGNAKSERPVR